MNLRLLSTFLVFSQLNLIRGLSTTLSPISLDPTEKIRVCGDRIRDILTYVCPKATFQKYYTPTDASSTPQEGREESIQNHVRPYIPQIIKKDTIPKRLRRQIVRECCAQACTMKDLMKYCSALEESYKKLAEISPSISAPSNSFNKSHGVGNAYMSIPMVYVPFIGTNGKKFDESSSTSHYKKVRHAHPQQNFFSQRSSTPLVESDELLSPDYENRNNIPTRMEILSNPVRPDIINYIPETLQLNDIDY